MIKLILLPLVLVALSGCKANSVGSQYHITKTSDGVECVWVTSGISCNWEKYNAEGAKATGAEEFIQ